MKKLSEITEADMGIFVEKAGWVVDSISQDEFGMYANIEREGHTALLCVSPIAVGIQFPTGSVQNATLKTLKIFHGMGYDIFAGFED